MNFLIRKFPKDLANIIYQYYEFSLNKYKTLKSGREFQSFDHLCLLSDKLLLASGYYPNISVWNWKDSRRIKKFKQDLSSPIMFNNLLIGSRGDRICLTDQKSFITKPYFDHKKLTKISNNLLACISQVMSVKRKRDSEIEYISSVLTIWNIKTQKLHKVIRNQHHIFDFIIFKDKIITLSNNDRLGKYDDYSLYTYKNYKLESKIRLKKRVHHLSLAGDQIFLLGDHLYDFNLNELSVLTGTKIIKIQNKYVLLDGNILYLLDNKFKLIKSSIYHHFHDKVDIIKLPGELVAYAGGSDRSIDLFD